VDLALIDVFVLNHVTYYLSNSARILAKIQSFGFVPKIWFLAVTCQT